MDQLPQNTRRFISKTINSKCTDSTVCNMKWSTVLKFKNDNNKQLCSIQQFPWSLLSLWLLFVSLVYFNRWRNKSLADESASLLKPCVSMYHCLSQPTHSRSDFHPTHSPRMFFGFFLSLPPGRHHLAHISSFYSFIFICRLVRTPLPNLLEPNNY